MLAPLFLTGAFCDFKKIILGLKILFDIYYLISYTFIKEINNLGRIIMENRKRCYVPLGIKGPVTKFVTDKKEDQILKGLIEKLKRS